MMEHVKAVVERELNQAERYLEQEKRHKEHLEAELQQTNENIAQSEKRIQEMRDFLNPPPIAHRMVCQINVDGNDLAKTVEAVAKKVKQDIERQVNPSYFHPKA